MLQLMVFIIKILLTFMLDYHSSFEDCIFMNQHFNLFLKHDIFFVKTLCCLFSSRSTNGLLQNLQKSRGTGFGIIHTGTTHHLPQKQVHPFCTINRHILRGCWILNSHSSSGSSFPIIEARGPYEGKGLRGEREKTMAKRNEQTKEMKASNAGAS
ncbi:hypothetical protein QQP08_013291 [Theobroma cacao]|nr:hypothetical protein QQP08_013291 [Theobroma cacao]